MKQYFLLDPSVVYLNHGSFGATPHPVMDAYQRWQVRLENQPVQFITTELLGELSNARKVLGRYINTQSDDLVFVPNVTFGVNIIARSLLLKPGDEILVSDHIYGACENVWKFICQKTGASLVQASVAIPFSSPEEVVEQLWKGVTPNTKIIFISHITSPTAFQIPVEIICQRARSAGIITIIDGAHAPGQIEVGITAFDPDFYVGNCHKWMLGPKGSGFLYTRREIQHLVEPLVVSWGWGENSTITTGSKYLDILEWWGTNDPSAYLAVPAAIQFQEEHDWLSVRKRCNQLLQDGLQRICDLTNLDSLYSNKAETYKQMAIAPLPPVHNLSEFEDQLYQKHRIEIPFIEWGDQLFVRISIQGYNTAADIDALLHGLAELLPQYTD